MSHPPHEIYDCNKISTKSKENWLIDFGLTKFHYKQESNDSNHDDILDRRGLLHGAGTEDKYPKKGIISTIGIQKEKLEKPKQTRYTFIRVFYGVFPLFHKGVGEVEKT